MVIAKIFLWKGNLPGLDMKHPMPSTHTRSGRETWEGLFTAQEDVKPERAGNVLWGEGSLGVTYGDTERRRAWISCWDELQVLNSKSGPDLEITMDAPPLPQTGGKRVACSKETVKQNSPSYSKTRRIDSMTFSWPHIKGERNWNPGGSKTKRGLRRKTWFTKSLVAVLDQMKENSNLY